METELNGLGDGSIRAAIEELELEQWDRASGECVFIHKCRVYKVVHGARVY